MVLFHFFAFWLVSAAQAFIPNELLGLSSPGSTYHTDITEMALIRHTREYFNSKRNVDTIGQISGNSAKELFTAMYGETADWKPFEQVIEITKSATSDVDSNEETKNNPKWHFDAERIHEGHENLIEQADRIVNLILNEHFDSAREILGKTLHPLQDFYSHSNWIELGNEDINRKLGIKGEVVGNVAPPGKQTCVDCTKDFSSRLKSGVLKATLAGLALGAAGGDEDNIFNCEDNVIADELTSGYYSTNQVDDNGLPVLKPTGVGKCSHGGTLDISSGLYATGGINKDASSALLSPHDYLHKKATIYAETASVFFLDHLRKMTNDDIKWGNFLQLLSGSSIAFVIDISEDMYFYLENVKNKIRQVLRESSQQGYIAEYILVPFSGRSAGPLQVAQVEYEVHEQIDYIELDEYLDETGDSNKRKIFEAMVMAAQRSWVGGVMYVITSGEPVDSYMMPWLDEILQRKSLTLHMRMAWELDSGTRFQRDEPSGTTINTKIFKDFSALTQNTGGDVIVVGQKLIEDTVELAAKSFKRVLLLTAESEGTTWYDLPVDSSVEDIEVSVFSDGLLPEISATDSSGIEVEPVKYQQNLLYAQTIFAKPSPGVWNLTIVSAAGQGKYTIAVRARSDIKIISRFSELDDKANTPHPGMHVVNNHLVAGANYVLELKAVTDQDIFLIYAQTRDANFAQINQFPVHQLTNNSFYADVVAPKEPFYVRLYGYDSNGYALVRTKQEFMVPTDLLIQISSPHRVLFPFSTDENGNRIFLSYYAVINKGPVISATIRIWDTENYTRDYEPKLKTVSENQSMEGEIAFVVPNNETFAVTTLFAVVKDLFAKRSNSAQFTFTF